MDEKIAISILRRYAPSEKVFKIVLGHSKAVQKLALSIAKKIVKSGVVKVDVDFVKTASLLHDVGRFEYPPGKDSIKHGVAGARILRKEGLPNKYALVCERHLGAGIQKSEVMRKKLPLPVKDYLPQSIEEKIIGYADNLLWGTRVVSIEKVIQRFTKEVGVKVGKRVKIMHDEISRLEQGR